ncbi:MAG: hypothetical protein KGH56_02095 [Patescibacteria group bacterium]|nr:hypothetical protein [Patescibacteria group bacterium]
MDDQDRARFVHDLYEFNDMAPAQEFSRAAHRVQAVGTQDRFASHVGHSMSHMGRGRKRIVDLHGWKLMHNHAHLLFAERVDHGLSLFLKKMRGYGRYFNERHKRRGVLFDKTKKIRIERHEQFLYILHYVHLNGLDDLPGAQGWRERSKGAIKNVDAAIAHLKADKWSSFRDYCAIRNFPSILTTGLFAGGNDYEAILRKYLFDRTGNEFFEHPFSLELE